jgi:hypothetical protein
MFAYRSISDIERISPDVSYVPDAEVAQDGATTRAAPLLDGRDPKDEHEQAAAFASEGAWRTRPKTPGRSE